jgi:dolichol-phosphate mannosyltransferase
MGSGDQQSVADGVLTLIVPVYNEGENFAALVAEIERHVPVPFRMLVVYDFDEDTTLPVARSLGAKRPWLQLVRNGLGRGVANALRAGFQKAPPGPALVVMADLSDDLTSVPRMLELYRQGNRIVAGSRYMRGGRQLGGPLVKRTLSRLAGLSLYYVAGLPTHDATNNFRLYDAEFVREVGIESPAGFAVALELTAKAFARGAAIAEVPTTWRDRTAGQSRFRLFKWLPSYLRWYFFALAAAPGRWLAGRGLTARRGKRVGQIDPAIDQEKGNPSKS